MGTVNGLPVGAEQFLRLEGVQGIMLGIIFWLLHAALIAIPWAALRPKPHQSIVKTLLIIMVVSMITIIPPIGLFSWGHPIAATGIIFPNTAWFGLTLWLIVVICLTRMDLKPTHKILPCLLILSLVCNIFASKPSAPQTWHVISTRYGSTPNKDNLLAITARHWQLKEEIMNLQQENMKVVIFPENIVGNWTALESVLWERWMKNLPYPDATLLIGAHQHINNTEFNNSLIILSPKGLSAYAARMSMPFGNYNPFANYSARIFPFEHGIKEIAGKKAALFICYESVLPWFHLLSQAQNPDIMIVASNLWWANHTTLPRAMEHYIFAMSRLFTIPTLIAKNS
jgi:apolipoprotein N-acyltransferase